MPGIIRSMGLTRQMRGVCIEPNQFGYIRVTAIRMESGRWGGPKEVVLIPSCEYTHRKGGDAPLMVKGLSSLKHVPHTRHGVSVPQLVSH